MWAVRLWEMETINALSYSELEWLNLPYDERVRKVCAYKLPQWLQSLETDREIKMMKAKR